MKVFWSLLLLLIAASAAYLAFGRGTPKDASPPRPTPPPVTTPTPPAPVEKPPVKEPEPTPEPPPPAPASTPAEPLTVHTPPAPAPAPTPAAPAATEETKPTPEPEATKPAETPKQDETEAPTPGEPPSPPAEDGDEATPAGESSASFGDAPKIVKQDDGSLLIDDKYPLKGEGTEASPYEITWEYLVSAQEDFQPRLGKKKLPGRMKLITGKHVKITGFVAFPVMATEPTEMLAMLNQWDGCCVGIPPSPYDAIEVRLKDAATTDQRLTTYGAVEGKLTVEPYLVRDWLVSLYSMEDARMTKTH